MADVPKLGGNTNKTPQAVRRELRMEAGGQVSADRPGVRESPSKSDIMDETTKIEIKVQELQLEVLEKLNTVTQTVLSSTETTAQTMEIIRTQLVDTNASTAVKKELQRLIEQHIQVLFESAVLGFKVSVSDTFGKVTEYFEQITATIQMAEIEHMLGNVRNMTEKDGVTKLSISQPSYLEAMWDKFKVHRGNAKAPKEPFPKDFDLSRIDKHSRNLLPIDPVESRQVLDKGYRELVGGLLWPARNAYPAASFACSVLSRYMQTPTEEAFSAGIHTLHYLVEHRHEGIVFSSDGNLEPICFYDSAHMQDMSDHKSSYGFVITWMGGPIVYVSKRHTLVGLSSAEDEYMTLTHAYKWVMWLRNLLTEMGYGYLVTNPTLMLGDNAQADRWAREAMITNGNRHIERDFHKIKEAVEQKHIEPRKIKGEDNTSDMFTKPVSKEVTEKLIGMLRGADGLPGIPISPYQLTGKPGGSSTYQIDVEHVRRRNEEIRNRDKSKDGDA